MKKNLVRVIAAFFLVYGIFGIIEYIANYLANVEFSNLWRVIFFLPYGIFSWLWPAVMLDVGIRLFTFHEKGREWAVGLTVIVLVLALIAGFLAPFIDEPSLSIQLLKWNFRLDGAFAIILFSGLLSAFLAAIFLFLRHKETKALFKS